MMHIFDTIGHRIWRQQTMSGPNVPLATPCVQLICATGRFDIYLFSAVPAFQAQKQPGKVELQGPVGRAVANSLVVVIQGAAVLVCRHEGCTNLCSQVTVLRLPF